MCLHSQWEKTNRARIVTAVGRVGETRCGRGHVCVVVGWSAIKLKAALLRNMLLLSGRLYFKRVENY